ncbi:MAG: ABC transporter substrate-binding protein [Oliverpabstia sp.]
MKRRIALLLTGVVVVGSILSGCGGTEAKETTEDKEASTEKENDSSDDEIMLTMAWWGNQVRNERTQKVLDDYSAENPNVTFDGQFSEWNDYWNKLATASAGHNLPDIVQLDTKNLEQYVKNGLLVDLTPYIEDGTLDLSDVDESIVEMGNVDDKTYAICNGINAPALLYNKTLLDENGISIKDNMTLDEFEAVSKEVYEKTGYKTNFGFGDDQLLEYIMRGEGICLYEDGKLGADSADDFKVYFDFMERGITEGWHLPSEVFAEGSLGSIEQDPVIYGSSPDTMSWCSFHFSNQYATMQEAAPEGIEIGITTWPSNDPVKSDFLKPSQFFAVTTDSKNPDEAVKVVNYLTNSIPCNEILLGERGVPIAKSVSEAIMEKMDEKSQEAVAFINNVVTPNSSAINPLPPDGSSEVIDLIKNLQEQVCYGAISSEEASVQLFEEGNQILETKAN